MTERMTACPVSWKCRVACLPTDESQQPTWPHRRHSRSSTHRVPSRRHSSHASGVRGGGKSALVSPSRCSHSSLVVCSFQGVQAVFTKASCDEQDSATCGIGCLRSAALAFLQVMFRPPSPTLGHPRDREEAPDLLPIKGVDAENIADGEPVIGALND